MINKQTRADKIKTQIENSNQERQFSVKKKFFSENNIEIRNQQFVQIIQREMSVIHSIAFEISHSIVRNFSNEIVIDFTKLFDAMLDEKLDRRLFSARRLFEKNSEIEKIQFHFFVTRFLICEFKRFAKQFAIQFTKQFANQFAEQSIFFTQNANDFAVRLFESKLKIENVNFFDSEKQEKNKSFTIIVHSSKHVFYKDVYVFVERLQDMAKQYDEKIIENLVIKCLRDDVFE